MCQPSQVSFLELSRNGSRKASKGSLNVLSPNTTSSVYTSEGRLALLSTIGVPVQLDHDPGRTEILVIRLTDRPSSGRTRRAELRPENLFDPTTAKPPVYAVKMVC